MAFNLTKKVCKELRRLANDLPEVKRVTSMVNEKMEGEDVLLTGIKKEADGSKIDPEKEYLIKNPLVVNVNHYLRLKKAYKKSGAFGAIAYCELIKEQTQSNHE